MIGGFLEGFNLHVLIEAALGVNGFDVCGVNRFLNHS